MANIVFSNITVSVFKIEKAVSPDLKLFPRSYWLLNFPILSETGECLKISPGRVMTIYSLKNKSKKKWQSPKCAQPLSPKSVPCYNNETEHMAGARQTRTPV